MKCPICIHMWICFVYSHIQIPKENLCTQVHIQIHVLIYTNIYVIYTHTQKYQYNIDLVLRNSFSLYFHFELINHHALSSFASCKLDRSKKNSWLWIKSRINSSQSYSILPEEWVLKSEMFVIKLPKWIQLIRQGLGQDMDKGGRTAADAEVTDCFRGLCLVMWPVRCHIIVFPVAGLFLSLSLYSTLTPLSCFPYHYWECVHPRVYLS